MFDHPDLAALLRAVLASPRDHLPRLVLADRLDELAAGHPGRDERAAFIRVQCEYERWKAVLYDESAPVEARLAACERRDRLQTASADLWPEVRGELLAEGGGLYPINGNVVAAPPKEYSANYTLVRNGFVELACCTLAGWERVGPAVAAKSPLAGVRLRDRRPRVRHSVEGRRCWAWSRPRSERASRPHVLPAAVWRLLPERGRQSREAWAADGAEDALSAMNRAALDWARQASRPGDGHPAPCGV